VAFHIEQAEFENGEQADRPCPNNHDIGLDRLTHRYLVQASLAFSNVGNGRLSSVVGASGKGLNRGLWSQCRLGA
jgi:hypothetical protein